ncbi:MAG: DUF1926 domain-containing protein [Chloroflexi bacterium]|nr:DUF1926 domain-containing protein [Chloroflexota bacterium]
MSKSIHLALGIHNHQPVGNFPEIFEMAYKKSYLPFVELLMSYPQIKVSLHYTGPLWDYFFEKHPEFIEKLKALVQSGQVEMMSGAYYEPILPNIPDRDKIEQIQWMNDVIRNNTGYEPNGMWLAERVWEPHLCEPVAMAGMKYSVLDESHFKYSGVPGDGIFGYYISEDDGYPLNLFPISYDLRHLIPFHEPHETIDFLESRATESGERLATFADDGEKFGVWPGTYKTAYEDKWLERFFDLLLDNSSWIKLITFSEYMKKYPPVDKVYLTCASYFEMMEWALPANTAKAFKKIQKEIKQSGKWEEYEPFLQGGFWRNFLRKYPESNNMQKRALMVSNKVHCMKGKETGRARNELWKCQCNCAYWHGVFGGLYLPHLRSAVYHHLIKAESLADLNRSKGKPYANIDICDYDCDSYDEVMLSTDSLGLIFRPGKGGRLFELDYKPAAVNLMNTMTRREEAYHDEVREAVKKHGNHDEGLVSIHEMIRVKEADLDQHLVYDWYDRASLLDHFITPETTIEEFRKCSYSEQGDFIDQPFSMNARKKKGGLALELKRAGGVWQEEEFLPLTIEKTVTLQDDRSKIVVDYVLTNPGDKELDTIHGMEWNFSFLSGKEDGFKVEGQILENRKIEGISSIEYVKNFSLTDTLRKLRIEFEMSVPSRLWKFPLETVSQSESGFERTFQQCVLLLLNRVKLSPGKQLKFNMKITVNPLEDDDSSVSIVPETEVTEAKAA